MNENEKIRISPDALIAMLVLEAESRELERLPSIEKAEEEFKPSEKFEQRMEELIKKENQKEQRKKIWKTIRKFIVSISFTLSLFVMIMLPVRAVQNAVVSTLIEWKDKFATVIFFREGEEEIEKELPAIDILYVPDDFVLAEPVQARRGTYYARYVDSVGRVFFLRAVKLTNSQSYMVDNEFSSYYSISNDAEQLIWGTLKDGSSTLLWEEASITFQIIGDLDLSEMLKIYEGIQF